MNKDDLSSALAQGTITRNEVIDVLAELPAEQQPARQGSSRAVNFNSTPIVALMYVSGLLISSAIVVFLFTITGFTEYTIFGSYYAYDDEGVVSSALINAGVLTLIAAGLYSAAFLLRRKLADVSSVRGVMVFSGVILLWYSTLYYAAAFEYSNISGDGHISAAVFALVLAALSSATLVYGLIVKQNVATYSGILGVSAAVLTIIYTFLDRVSANHPFVIDVNIIVFITVMALLALSTRALSTRRVAGERDKLDYLALLLSLIAVWFGQFTDLDILWLLGSVGLCLAVLAWGVSRETIAYIATAAFFLAVSVLVIAFKFFGGYSVAFALLLSAVGIAGIAVGFVYVSKNLSTISDRWWGRGTKGNDPTQKVPEQKPTGTSGIP